MKKLNTSVYACVCVYVRGLYDGDLGFLVLLLLYFLLVHPDSNKLVGSCQSKKTVDKKETPVLRNNDKRISGPNNTCSHEYSRLRETQFISWSGHISHASHNQAPFTHWCPEEDCLWACWMVVERSQFSR